MRVKQSKIPLEVRRLAADHLESLRTAGMGFDAGDLFLGDDVTPIYRPDIDGPAYYEFQILKATRDKPGGRADLANDIAKANIVDARGYSKIYESPGFSEKVRPEGPGATAVQGFITVATGDHDFPIPHWSLDEAPVSTSLEREAARKKKAVQRVYKLDALAYVAEDSNGGEIASLGEPPYLVRNAPDDLASATGRIASTEPADLSWSDSPDLPRMRAKSLRRRGPQPPDIKLDRAKSWGALKKDYAKNFKPKLKQLRNEASKTWQVEKAIREYGEGLQVAETHYVALLEKAFSVEVSGEAAEYVRVRVLKRPGGLNCLELVCGDPQLGREASFTVHIAYPANREEQLNFFVYTPDMASRGRHQAEEG